MNAPSRMHVPDIEQAPAHLTPPSAAGWQLWRTFECRTAGFPAGWARELASPELAAAADALLVARRERDAAWADARAWVKAAIRQGVRAKEGHAGEDPPPPDAGAELRRLRTASRAIDRLRSNDAVRAVVPGAVIAALERTDAAWAACDALYRATFAGARDDVASTLLTICRRPAFRDRTREPLRIDTIKKRWTLIWEAYAKVSMPVAGQANAEHGAIAEQIVPIRQAERCRLSHQRTDIDGPVRDPVRQ